MATPLDIEIIMHAYARHEPYDHGGSSVVRDIVNGLAAADIISVDCWERNEALLEITARGRAYVEKLLSIPFPKIVETYVFEEV